MATTKYQVPKGITAKIEMIGQVRALELLQNAAENRNVSPGRVAAYRQMIERGEWHTINQGIAVGEDGKLYDGQHRLWAIAESDVTVPVLVMYGLTKESREAIDKGRSRSVADELRMFSGMTNAAALVSYVKTCARIYAGGNSERISFQTRSMFEEWYSCFKEGCDSAIEHLSVSGAAKEFRRASVGGAFAFAMKASPDKVCAMMQKLRDGTGLEKGEPMWALRRALLESSRAESDTSSETIRKVLRAIHMGIRGEKAEKIQVSEKGIAYFRKSYDGSRKLKGLLAPFKGVEGLHALNTAESIAAAEAAGEKKEVG